MGKNIAVKLSNPSYGIVCYVHLCQWYIKGPNHIGRATRFVDSGFPTLLILGPTLLILGPPLSILGPTLLILEPILLILVVKMGVAILKKTDTIQTVDSGFE